MPGYIAAISAQAPPGPLWPGVRQVAGRPGPWPAMGHRRRSAPAPPPPQPRQGKASIAARALPKKAATKQVEKAKQEQPKVSKEAPAQDFAEFWGFFEQSIDQLFDGDKQIEVKGNFDNNCEAFYIGETEYEE